MPDVAQPQDVSRGLRALNEQTQSKAAMTTETYDTSAPRRP